MPPLPPDSAPFPDGASPEEKPSNSSSLDGESFPKMEATTPDGGGEQEISTRPDVPFSPHADAPAPEVRQSEPVSLEGESFQDSRRTPPARDAEAPASEEVKQTAPFLSIRPAKVTARATVADLVARSDREVLGLSANPQLVGDVALAILLGGKTVRITLRDHTSRPLAHELPWEIVFQSMSKLGYPGSADGVMGFLAQRTLGFIREQGIKPSQIKDVGLSIPGCTWSDEPADGKHRSDAQKTFTTTTSIIPFNESQEAAFGIAVTL